MVNQIDMLFPGYVTVFRDEKKYIHLYFFPGIDMYNQYYYNMLDLSDCKVKYKQIQHSDNAMEFIFLNRKIFKISCKLISKYNDIEYKTLNVF